MSGMSNQKTLTACGKRKEKQKRSKRKHLSDVYRQKRFLKNDKESYQ